LGSPRGAHSGLSWLYVVSRIDDARSCFDPVAILHFDSQPIPDMNVIKIKPEETHDSDNEAREYSERDEAAFHSMYLKREGPTISLSLLRY
jgi:hypothetical protein